MSIKYDFETIANKMPGSLKDLMTPDFLKEKGVVSFAAGELDFATAPSLNKALIDLASNGLYGFTLRNDEYLNAVTWWMKEVRNANVKNEEIVTTLGTIYSLATTIKAFSNEKDAIIVQSPYYSRYKQAADRLNRRTVYNNLIEEGNRYSIDFEDLEAKMQDPRNKILVLNNPLNPSGNVFTIEELRKVSELSNKYKVVVFCDEIFADIVLDNEKIIPYIYVNENDKYGISCTSLGKAFNLTGVNHANVLIKDENLRERFTLQRTNDHYGSIDPTAQAMVLGAYSKEGLDWLIEMSKHIKENSNIVHKTIEEYFPECKIFENKAAFVAWLDFSNLSKNNEELENYLLNKCLFHVDMSDEYGGKQGQFRMSLGSTRNQIIEAMERLRKGFGR